MNSYMFILCSLGVLGLIILGFSLFDRFQPKVNYVDTNYIEKVLYSSPTDYIIGKVYVQLVDIHGIMGHYGIEVVANLSFKTLKTKVSSIEFNPNEVTLKSGMDLYLDENNLVIKLPEGAEAVFIPFDALKAMTGN